MTSASLSPLVCIIVHYGNPDITADCLASLLAGNGLLRIIVVSNTDSAGTEALQLVLCQRQIAICLAQGGHASAHSVVVLPLGSNKGFAAACNAGLRCLQHGDGVRFVWLLNNDATVAPDAAQHLLDCLVRHPRALCGTSVFRADAPEILELALGCRFSPLTTIITPCHARALPQDVQSAPQVAYIYGASLAFPLSLVDDIGVLDEDFFLYYEEHDYCVRARKAGYVFHWCREALVWHGFRASGVTPCASLAMREFKHFHETRSTVLFLRKHHALLLLPALLFRSAAKIGILCWRGEARVRLLASYFRGIYAGLSAPKA